MAKIRVINKVKSENRSDGDSRKVSGNGQPLVSVIMPVYNAEKYLKGSVHAVLNQTYKNIELICINDGSKDNSLSILKNIAESDERLIIIDQENGGPASARNAGLNKAKGKYISFVDADDSVDCKIYETAVAKAEKEDADILVFGGTPFPDNGNIPDWIWRKMSPPDRIYTGSDEVTEALFHEESSRPFLWLHMIKRSIIEQSPALRMNEKLDLGEDQLFQFMYFPRAKKVVYISNRLYFYRWINEGSLMWRYNHQHITKFRKHLTIVENVLEGWNNAGYRDIYGNMVSWIVVFLYYDLITFPEYYKHKFAKCIIDTIEKYGYNLYMCNEYEMAHVEEILKFAENANEENFDEICNRDITSMENKINDIEYQISETMKSKTFKIGRMLTSKKKRVNIEDLLPPTEKRN